MSKYLIKILSICAFVILLPLVVVGGALCVTEAIGITLTVKAAGIEGGVNTESHVAIYIDGHKQDNNTIKIKKNTTVKVEYEGVGYDFLGWYQGSYNEVAPKIANNKAKTIDGNEKKTTCEFIVRGNTTLTAVRNVKTYTVSYEGKMADGTKDIDLPTENLLYGQDLAVLADQEGTCQLKGWYVKGTEEQEGAVTTQVATFDQSGEYVLVPYWVDQAAIQYTLHVQYHAQSTETQDVTFSLAEKFGAYRERAGYELLGFKCGDTIYNETSANFTGLIEAADANNEINVVAVWECDYQQSFNLGVGGDIAVFTNAAHTNQAVVNENDTSINFADEEYCYDLTDDVFVLFKEMVGATKFYNNEGVEVEWNGQFKLSVNGGPHINDTTYNHSSKTLTFAKLMAYLEAAYKGKLDGAKVVVTLTFVPVA